MWPSLAPHKTPTREDRGDVGTLVAARWWGNALAHEGAGEAGDHKGPTDGDELFIRLMYMRLLQEEPRMRQITA